MPTWGPKLTLREALLALARREAAKQGHGRNSQGKYYFEFGVNGPMQDMGKLERMEDGTYAVKQEK